MDREGKGEREMITLQTSGQFYRYFTQYRMTPPTDLCTFFWKLLGSAAILTFIGVFCGVYIIGAWAFFMLPYHWSILPFALFTIIAIALGILLGILYLFEEKDILDSTAVRVLVEGFQGIKDKYCPLVTYK